jgi:glycosyltransferase involved in cell wall biosynthesis
VEDSEKTRNLPTLSHIIYSDLFLQKKSAGIGHDSVTMYNKLRALVKISKVSEIPEFSNRSFRHRVFHKFGVPFNFSYDRPAILWLEQFSLLFIKRKVTFIRTHDVFPISNPEWFRFLSRFKFHLSVNSQLKKDPVLVFNSQATRNEFEKYRKCDGVVVWCEPNLEITPPCEACEGCRFNESRPKEVYSLSVGTIEPRKNYNLLLRIAEIAADVNVPLHFVIVGRYGWKSRRERKKLRWLSKRNITWLKDACDFSVTNLMLNCAVFISTSKNEGFGLPTVESRLQDCNLVISDIPVYREIHGDSASVSYVSLNASPQHWLENIIVQSSREKSTSRHWRTTYFSKCETQTNKLMIKIRQINESELSGDRD